MSYDKDKRIVITLDAGGTNFRFSAMGGNKAVTKTIAMPSNGDDLKKCLSNILAGFAQVKKQCPQPPAALSFAFPGPADYPAGIIGDLGNLPGSCGGVALDKTQRQHKLAIRQRPSMHRDREHCASYRPIMN